MTLEMTGEILILKSFFNLILFYFIFFFFLIFGCVLPFFIFCDVIVT